MTYWTSEKVTSGLPVNRQVQESAAALGAPDLVSYKSISVDWGTKLRMLVSLTERSFELAYAPSAEPIHIRARQSCGP